MADTVQDRIQKVICDHLQCDPEKVTSDTTFDALGADSLDRIELAMGIEEEFDLEIPDDVATPWVTVGDAEKYVTSKIN